MPARSMSIAQKIYYYVRDGEGTHEGHSYRLIVGCPIFGRNFPQAQSLILDPLIAKYKLKYKNGLLVIMEHFL
jgi:hypothetical protein